MPYLLIIYQATNMLGVFIFIVKGNHFSWFASRFVTEKQHFHDEIQNFQLLETVIHNTYWNRIVKMSGRLCRCCYSASFGLSHAFYI